MSKQEKQYSDAMRIFEALSGVDVDLLERSEAALVKETSEKKTKLFSWRYGRVAAAALCFVVTGVMLWGAGSGMLRTMYSSTDSATTNEVAEAEKGAFMAEEMPMEQEAASEIQSAIAPEAMEQIKDEEADVTDNTMNHVNTDGYLGTTAGAEDKEMDGKGTEDAVQDLQDLQISQSGASLEKLSAKSISETEARAEELYGNYVPDALPEGYVWESGHLLEDEETGTKKSLQLVWTRGLDSIQLKIEEVNLAELEIADPNKPETFNEHLYEIPYAETVPEEYRAIFNDPIFEEQDFSLELVEARMKSVSDSGDTDTPRGRFAVLYDNGILVTFSGRGTAQEIWEMFQTMKR